jgi:hypothetical protein
VTGAELSATGLVIAFPDNPRARDYPARYRPIADFCSACFQYMLIMSETVYRVPPDRQKLFFNEGLHRSMIWVLDKYILTIRQIPIDKDRFMGPVFENLDLGPRKTAFAALTKTGARAIEAADKILKTLDPDDPLFPVMKNVKYYVGVATPQPQLGPDKGGHLPDVGPYWRA